MDSRINEIWLCAYKFDYCILKYISGTFNVISAEELKALLKDYEQFLEKNNLTTVTGSNSQLTLGIDDRLSRFLSNRGIESIHFSNKEELSIVKETCNS